MTSLAVIIIVPCIKQLLAVENFTVVSETIINPVVLPGDNPGSCAAADARQEFIARLETTIKRNIVAVSVSE